jgi:FAD synthase
MLLDKIRENQKFDDLDSLKNQIKKDIAYVKQNPDYVLTF